MAGPARFPTLLVLGLVLLPNNTANTAFVGRFRQEVEPKRDFLLQGTFPAYTELPLSRSAYYRSRRRPGSVSVHHTKIPGTIGCAPTRLQRQGGNMSDKGQKGRNVSQRGFFREKRSLQLRPRIYNTQITGVGGK